MTLPRNSSPATEFSAALLAEFVRLGVRDVVLGPGSRSQALALAAAEFERVGRLRLRVRIDERVGGFLALGIAVETNLPVLVITTSGTAVANLHPAVLEAHHSGVPLIIITADRPEALRGLGSNQTTEQPGIFGAAVLRTWDVGPPSGESGETDAAAALARDAMANVSGPVHLNLSFAEPLSSPFRQSSEAETETRWSSEAETPQSDLDKLDHRSPINHALTLTASPGTIVIAGTGGGERAEEVARELGVPLIAEVSSGAHFGPNLIVAYRELFEDAAFGGRVERVIVFGHPTLSREVPAIIQRAGVEAIVVRGLSADDYNPGRRVSEFVDSVVVERGESDRAWLGTWVSASRALTQPVEVAPDSTADAGTHARAELAAVRASVTRRSLAEAVWRSTWPHDRLVLGASRLIREVDRYVPGKKIRVHANRGLAGIDGTISTALGIALSSQADAANSAGTTRVLLGDLAFFHDAGALLFGVGEARPRIQVIVGNDAGGTIFDGLEVGAFAGPAFDRVLLTPQQASIEQLAMAYGWDYRRVETRGGLDQALTASLNPTVIEVPLDR